MIGQSGSFKSKCNFYRKESILTQMEQDSSIVDIGVANGRIICANTSYPSESEQNSGKSAKGATIPTVIIITASLIILSIVATEIGKPKLNK
jgi:hypothetical protein